MNKFLKWLLAVVGVVVVLVVIAAVVLPMVIDPNDYKQEISTAVLDETGRELTIGGDIQWTVFPSIGLQLTDVSLGNRSGFGDQPMLDIGEAGMSVKLMPLFQRKMEIGEVKLSDVLINLRRNANGQSNWEDLTAARPETEPAPSDSGRGAGSFTVSGIQISNANVIFDDAGEKTELKEFGLQASNIELGRPFDLQGGFSVNLQAQQLAGDVTFGGRVQSEANGDRYGIEGLEISFDGTSGSGAEALALNMDTRANANIDLASDTATLADFVLQLHDLSVSGGLDVTSISGSPEFAGRLTLAEFNPKSLLKALGMEVPVTANDAALTQLQADMSFAGSMNSTNMRDLIVKFDQSTFNGNLKIDGFDTPKLAFDFEVDRLNVDDYLPPTDSGGSDATGAGGTGEEDLSVELFRGFTGGGDFRIGELVVAGLTATDVSLKMSSDGNGIRFYPVNALFYGGKHEGDIRIDARGERPMLSADLGLTGVQSQSLLEDLAGTARLQGAGDVSLNIRTDLTNSGTVLKALSGDLAMSMLDGALVGIDVADTIGAVKMALGKQDEVVETADDSQKTEFAELMMSGKFEQGVLSSDDLSMTSPLLRATGAGKLDLVSESIDYVLKPVLTGEQAGMGQLSGVPIPIRLSGNLYEPSISVDVVAAIAGSQKELINRKKDELIGGLLGGKDDADAGDQQAGEEEKSDPAKALLDGIFGKKKDKKKDDDGGAHP
ncbi:MAG: AsmA family protein [Gammaproteobacteria bacterium]|nr:AsmA family protein [Gammaproteobacteria bacterium]